jgi:hypothetical protein
MLAPSRKNPPSKYLCSWKEIANYMGKGVRTVQRYEAQFGLPIRRPAGKSRASVVATRAEIDAWVAASPLRETHRLLRSESRLDPELKAIRDGIREMHALREQMSALRKETRVSLGLLLSTARSVRVASEYRWKMNDAQDDALRRAGIITDPHPGSLKV